VSREEKHPDRTKGFKARMPAALRSWEASPSAAAAPELDEGNLLQEVLRQAKSAEAWTTRDRRGHATFAQGKTKGLNMTRRGPKKGSYEMSVE